MARWDHVFGERDKFYALFSEQHGFEYRSTNGFGPPVVGSGNIDNNRTFTGLTLDETHVLTPSMVLDVRANYFRFVQLTPGYTEQAQSITPASVGMTGMIQAPTVSQAVIPNINIGGFASPLFGSGSFSWSPYNSWQFAPNLTWQKGRHAFRFGFEVHYEAKRQRCAGQRLWIAHIRQRPDAASLRSRLHHQRRYGYVSWPRFPAAWHPDQRQHR